MYYKNLSCRPGKVWDLSLKYGDSQNMNLGQYGAFVLLKEWKHIQMHQSLTSEAVPSISALKESISP